MKSYQLFTLLLLLILSLPSCTKISSYLSFNKKELDPKDEVNFQPVTNNAPDSPCKKALNKALEGFSKEIPVIGADLDILVNIMTQYQACEMVKRDDRIAEVLLKLLERVKVLEGEVGNSTIPAVDAGQ